MNEQEIKAWSLLIASLMKGPCKTDDPASELAAYKDLAGDISAYIGSGKAPFTDPRFQK